MSAPCTARAVTNPAEWEALFARVPRPHMTQSWAYGEAKRAATGWRTRRVVFDAGGWRPRRFVIRRGNEPVAVCQLLDKRLAGVTLASRLNRGPLFLDAEPDEALVRGVYRLLRGNAIRGRRPLVLAPALPDSPEAHRLLDELGFRRRQGHGWVSDCVDLRPDEEEMHRNLHSKWRRLVRRAEEAGVEFRVCESREELAWIVERHARHMQEKQFVGMNPAFLYALHAASRPGDFLVTQALLDGEPVGAMVTYLFGVASEGLIFWAGEEARLANAGRHLYWHTALELKRRGCACFDLGGKRAGATETFKAGMGGTEYRLLGERLAI